MRPRTSRKAARFEESVIREMTRISNLEGGINLAQGFPDFEAPAPMKEAAKRAIDADINQYAITWGAESLRKAVARRTSEYNRIPTDPTANVTVCCGATEAMIASLLAILDPGDEVCLFEPFYENYGPDCWISGAVPRFVRLHAPDWTIDFEELEAAMGEKTRAIVINTPQMPIPPRSPGCKLCWKRRGPPRLRSCRSHSRRSPSMRRRGSLCRGRGHQSR